VFQAKHRNEEADDNAAHCCYGISGKENWSHPVNNTNSSVWDCEGYIHGFVRAAGDINRHANLDGMSSQPCRHALAVV